MIHTMGLHKWTEAERKYVEDNTGRMKDREMAAKLSLLTGRQITAEAVALHRRLKMRIGKVRGPGKPRLAKPKNPQERESS